MSVTTNTPVSAFAILRLSAATHTVDNDQRRVPLQIISASQNSYALRSPAIRVWCLQVITCCSRSIRKARQASPR